jgi:hypothetical protein
MGLVGNIFDIRLNRDEPTKGYWVDFRLWVSDGDLERSGSLMPRLQDGVSVQLIAVEGSSTKQIVDETGKVTSIMTTSPMTEPEDSEPAGDEENDEYYEEDASGPPPVIPPASEPTAAEADKQDDKKNKAESGEPGLPSAEERLAKLAEVLRRKERLARLAEVLRLM